ncbi:MAG TPA: ABC-F family ATP-binding cassette domain-containing protein [Blastocatellia bacterium]|nr:ABC-F family ATP-binding cassette domain-containing protein [Blastocatellia bacterium]
MPNHLSAVDLGYCLPDGSSLFTSLTFSFSAVRTGLVGPNGVGKTTLLEILVGNLHPSGGALDRGGRISYLPQTVTFAPGATVVEAIRLADALAALDSFERGEGTMQDFELIEDRWDLPERIRKTFEQMGVPDVSLARPVSSLSGGELMRVRLAGLLLEDPDFLILDEPTNHLDLSAREFVYGMVAAWRKGLIVVSHDRRLLSDVDQIAEMSSDGMKMYGGNFGFYREQRRIERNAAEQTLQGAQQRLKEARLAAQRTRERQEKRSSAGRRKALTGGIPPIVAGGLKRKAENTTARLKGRHEQRTCHARQEVKAARQNLPPEHQIIVDLERSTVPAQKRMVELAEVNYRYPGAAQNLWHRPLSLEIVGPERVWLKGPNGSGKSTLIDLICGRESPTAGRVRVGTERIGLLDQQISVLDDSLTILDNLKRIAPLRPEHELRILLGRFLFIHDEALKPVAVLSGGERMRAGLACLLGADQSPEILIADEPTNNLDLSSVEELISALKGFQGVLIVAGHDTAFLDEIGIERVIELPPE